LHPRSTDQTHQQSCPFKDALRTAHIRGNFIKADIPKEGFEAALTADPQDVKVTLYSLLAAATEDLWKEIQPKIPSDNYYGLVRPSSTTPHQQAPGRRQHLPISSKEISEMVLNSKSSQAAAKNISQLLGDFFKVEVEAYIERVQKAQEYGRPKWFEPLSSLLESTRDMPRTSGTSGLLRAGFNTARKVFWNSYGVLPAVFENEMRREPTQAELATIGKRSHLTMLRMATGHLAVLTSFLHTIQEDRSYSDDGYGDSNIPFVADRFRLTTTNPATAILEPIGELMPQTTLGTSQTLVGCPAVYAKGTTGLNVISEFLQWNHEIALEVYFPHILELADS